MKDLTERKLVYLDDAIDVIVGCTNCGTEDELRAYVTRHSLENGWSGGIVDAIDAIKRLPSAQPEQRSFSCGQENDVISRQAAKHALCKAVHKNEDIPCENQTASCLWSKTRVCDYAREIDALPSAQPERTCVNCGRTANNGGWYADGGTRCPIEEHYALPKDGYCHLWEKRNVSDDDYPERREK